jgi:hypothetical protein
MRSLCNDPMVDDALIWIWVIEKLPTGALPRTARKGNGEKRTLSKAMAFMLFKQSVLRGQQARQELKEAQAAHKEAMQQHSSSSLQVCSCNV